MTKKPNKYNLRQMVYFLALDSKAKWTVYGSIIRSMRSTPDGWEYTIKGNPVNYLRKE